MSSTQDHQYVDGISAHNLTIQYIFCDDYLFTIPNYQRPYSWEDMHCKALLDDLHSVVFKGEKKFDELPPYFLGSAVVIKKPNSRHAQVVDGQQRLTTLTILLSCLRYVIENQKYKDTLSDFIFQKEDELRGTEATYRLKTRPRDQDFFNKLIQSQEGLLEYMKNPERWEYANDAQAQIAINVKVLLDDFATRKYGQDQFKLLAQYIIQKCVLVIVASTNEDMAFRIFNVLNDRGKDLTIADILKSEVLERIDKKDEDLYTEKWEECETRLGMEAFKDFFSHLRSIFAKKKAEKSVLNEIREYAKPSENPKVFIDSYLIPFSNAYLNIVKENYQSSQHAEEINGLFKKLKRVAHTDWIPSAIYFIARQPSAPSSIRNFLLQLEKITLAMEARKYTVNERMDRYAKINTRIEKDMDLYDSASEFMLWKEDRISIIYQLQVSDLYGKSLVKPILAKIEEKLNDNSVEINYESINIEHILPQKPTSEYWTSRFTPDDRTKLTNNLGNLSLISVRKNSQAKNYDFITKVNVYFKADGKASNLAMVNILSESQHWNPNDVKLRNTAMVNEFLKAVGLEILSDKEEMKIEQREPPSINE